MIYWFERHSKICWLFVFIIGGIIFYMSSLTLTVGGKSGNNLLSILYHIFAFFFFAFFLLMALVRGKYRRFALFGILISVLYGISDEIHQLFVPGRYGSIADVGYDSVGIVFAFLIYMISVEVRRK
jgi:VanZ family protein